MEPLITADNILEKAIAAIHLETGLRLNIIANNGEHIDAIIQMPDNGVNKGEKLFVVIKKRATQINLGAVINQIKTFEPNHGLFVTEYINPKMAQRFKEAGIQFIDVAGNAYINQPPFYIYIKGNKPQQDIPQQNLKTGKAFQPAGMKVIFAFLQNNALINAPYREIAVQAQVALGAVGWIIRDLIAQGFILEGFNKKQRQLANLDLLLNKWVEEYPYKLKGKYKIGTFTTDDHDWWKKINIEKFNAMWGGEIAAEKYTNYLNPKHATVYIDKKDMKELMRAVQLRKPEAYERPDIQIDLIAPFWNKEVNTIETVEQAGLAPPIITYADLIETGDTRNLDTARRLREQYIH